MMRSATKPMRSSPAAIIVFAGQRSAGQVDRHLVAQAERTAQDDLLVAERRVQLGKVDLAARTRRPFARKIRVEGERVRSRAPRTHRSPCDGRCRESRPGACSSASRPSARRSIIAEAPSVIGAQS
jgi:hypothetical protein